MQNHPPDLVIMDLSMPRISGLGAMQEIKRVNARAFRAMSEVFSSVLVSAV